MTEKKRRRGCLKGCALGCLVLVILGVGFFGIAGLLQFRASRIGSDPISDAKSRELPPIATQAQLADARTSQSLQISGQPVEKPVVSLATPAGKLVIDFSVGDLTVVPSDGDSIEVDADYDRSRFELLEDYQQAEDGTWIYSVSLHPKLRFMGFAKVENRMEIRIPRTHPLRLEGEIKMGQSNLELGGLWLSAVDLEVGMGQSSVSFDEPTAAALESFSMKGRMGQIEVHELGNASPAEVTLSHRMGQLDLDLEGDWRTDSSISARCTMGECAVNAAEGVHYISESSRIMFGGKSGHLPDDSELGPDAPTLRVELGASMGNVRVH